MEITPAALESTQTTGSLLDPATGAGNDVTDEYRRYFGLTIQEAHYG